MTSRAGSALTLLLGLVAGWAGATLLSPGALAITSSRREPTPASPCIPSLDAGQLAMLRAELAASSTSPSSAELVTTGSAPAPSALEELPAVEPAPAAPPAAPQLTPEHLEAAARAHHHLDDAITRGRWTEDDRSLIRSTLPNLAPTQLDAVMSKLVLAINSGRLLVEQPGPLL